MRKGHEKYVSVKSNKKKENSKRKINNRRRIGKERESNE